MVGVPKSTGKCRLILVYRCCNTIRVRGMSEAKDKGMPCMASQHCECLANGFSVMRRGRIASTVERTARYVQDLLLDIRLKTLGLNWTLQASQIKQTSGQHPKIKVSNLT
jgi:hypothetical protein